MKKLLWVCCFCCIALMVSAQKQSGTVKVLEKLCKTVNSIQTISGKLEITFDSPEPETDIVTVFVLDEHHIILRVLPGYFEGAGKILRKMINE